MAEEAGSSGGRGSSGMVDLSCFSNVREVEQKTFRHCPQDEERQPLQPDQRSVVAEVVEDGGHDGRD